MIIKNILGSCLEWQEDLSKKHLKVKMVGLNCLLWREGSVTCRANALLSGVCKFRNRDELLSEV